MLTRPRLDLLPFVLSQKAPSLGTSQKTGSDTPLPGTLPTLSSLCQSQYEGQIRSFAERYLLNSLEDPVRSFYLKSSDSKYVDAGPLFCELVGLEPEEVQGKTDFDLFSSAQAEQRHFDDLIVRTTGQTVVSELRVERDGVLRTLRFLQSPIRLPHPEGVSVLGLLQDVTRESSVPTLTDQLPSDELQDVLFRGCAHDLANLLAPVSGNLEFVLSQMEASDSNYPLLARARSACSRAIGLFRRMCLDSSRSALVAPTPLSLNEVLGEFLELFSGVMPPSIRLQTHLSPELWDVVVDREQLLQVLSNLFFNARDAMSDGGTLVFETTNVGSLGEETGGAETQPYVRLRVSDTGEGIPRDLHSRIFTPHFSSKGQGRGLGLALVSHIVRRAGGWISCSSLPKRGTDFFLFFPRHRS